PNRSVLTSLKLLLLLEFSKRAHKWTVTHHETYYWCCVYCVSALSGMSHFGRQPMSNQLSYLQSLGFVQSPWSSVLFFLFAGALYFLAPAVGYAEGKRGILLASMWAMVIKLATSTFRERLVSIQVWYAPPAPPTWNVSP